MSIRHLDRLLQPKSIAVIGASTAPDGQTLRYVLDLAPDTPG